MWEVNTWVMWHLEIGAIVEITIIPLYKVPGMKGWGRAPTCWTDIDEKQEEVDKSSGLGVGTGKWRKFISSLLGHAQVNSTQFFIVRDVIFKAYGLNGLFKKQYC